MAESSSHKSPSPEIKEEPVTLDKPESPNLFLPTTQVDFTFDEIAFTTNNEVALIYPLHPNQEYLMVVSYFISKCCIKEAFTRASTPYKEYLRYTGEIRAKGTLKKSCLPPRWRLLMAQIMQCLGGKTGGLDQISNKDAAILYCLAHGVQVDYAMIIWDDLIHKLNKKTRDKIVPYPRTPFTDHMKAICNLVMHVDFKAPKPSSQPDKLPQGKKSGATTGLRRSNLNVLVDKTKSTGDGLKTVNTESGASKELGANEISKKIKLEDLADLLKDTRYAFFTPDSPPDEPINVSDESDQEEVEKAKETLANSQDVPEDTSSQKKELEKLKAATEAEVASLKVKPSYPDINQLTTLLVTSLKPELSKLLASHDFASCLPTKLKEILSKIIGLSGEIKELKQHIKDMEIELHGDLKEIPSKLETFTSTISNLSSQDAKLKNIQ
nr:hypothetical protein [Tanacetum cinerariifolium]